MKVNKELYVEEHGSNPRGSGLWIFTVRAGHSFCEIQKTGPYTQARKEALQEAKDIGGAQELIVQP